jgi:hypothetical protein
LDPLAMLALAMWSPEPEIGNCYLQ